MSQILFQKNQAKNFQSFEDIEFIVRPGKHLIVGENRSSNSANSNGSGKSTLFEMVVWTLFKKTNRGKDPSRDYEGNCFTSVEFVKGGDLYRVDRYWKDKVHKNDLFLFKNGEEISLRKNTSTEEELQKLIGISYDIFISSVVVLQGLPMNFTALQPTIRKNIFEEMVGFSVWEEYAEKFKGVHHETMLLRDQKHSQFNDFKLKMTDLNARIQTMKAAKLQAKEEFESQIKEIQDKLSGLNVQLEEAGKEQDKGLQTLIQHRNQNDIRRDISQSQARIHSLKKITNTGICSECEQCYPMDKLTAAQDELLVAMNKLDSAWNENIAYEAADKEYATARTKVDNLQLQRGTYKSQLNSIFQRMNQQQASVNIDPLEEQLNGYLADVNGLKSEIDELTSKIDNVKYLAELMLPSSQFRTFVLERYITYLNSIIDSIMPLIFDDLTLKLVAGSKGSGIELEIQHNGKDKEYKSLSGGEKKRLDIAIILSFIRFLLESAGVSTNLVVLDEIFDALDIRGIDNVMNCLDSLFPEDAAVYIITHNDSLKSTFNSVVKVTKENNISKIEGYNG